jgi:hypothetical protein
MNILSKDQLSKGKFIMLYGDSGKGKTTSIIQSAPNPIAYIAAELRDLQSNIDAANRPDLDMDVFRYNDIEDLKQTISKLDNFTRYSTVCLDSYTHLMAVDLSNEIEDEVFDSLEDKFKRKKLIAETKLSLEGYGGLSGQMVRITKMLQALAFSGKIVIVTARLVENPKWDRELSAGPALKGKEFPLVLPGFLDIIGLVESRSKVDESGNPAIVYPPMVSFESPSNDFLCKWTGPRPSNKTLRGPLNIMKLLKIKEV